VIDRIEASPLVLAALQDFANRNGRRWKHKLSMLWAAGHDTEEPEGWALRHIRNRFGPTWLAHTCKIRPAAREPVRILECAEILS
jgi:hypothetical protein